MFNLKQFLGLSYYISGLDRFLKEYDERHPRLSASQRAEVEKYQRIYHLRDDAKQNKTVGHETLWEGF